MVGIIKYKCRILLDNHNYQSVSESITINVSNLATYVAESGFEKNIFSRNKGTDLVNLYPNPSNGTFTIDISTNLLSEVNNISIVNIKGEILYRGILMSEESSRQFDLSYLDSGNYIIMITNDNAIYTKKFIKN